MQYQEEVMGVTVYQREKSSENNVVVSISIYPEILGSLAWCQCPITWFDPHFLEIDTT
jgi:hypothetical protein